MRTKLILAGLTIVMAVGFLAFAGVREGWVYFLPVDEFVADSSHQFQRVRLHGRVAEANLDIRPADLHAGFDLLGDAASLRVEYAGVIPDLLKGGVDVVVEGCRDSDGVFRADTLLTKCASKYETSDGQSPHGDPNAGRISS
jgi:cytochrome c-type biogenesis protein CcmE